MSALSTPGGGGTTAQSKPTSGKQKYQKLDINSLYCANRNENLEPSSVKSQLSRKHGMQSLGKVPSARRPPANLPSLKTETGQDPNINSVSVVATTAPPPPTCASQAITTTTSGGITMATGPGGWVPLPPPSSPHFRTEFPSLEAAAAQPSHRSSDHSGSQPQLRPQTEGSWTCGGTAGVRPEGTSSPSVVPVPPPTSQQTPAFRAILPSFAQMKGSSGGGIGLGSLGALRDNRSSGPNSGSANGAPRAAPRQPATPRAVEVLTARPILREEQISSLDDISRDAGWAQNDDIDYDQKLDFSDGETSASISKSNNSRVSIENDRLDLKINEPGDEEQLWAERRQKQSNEVAQIVARAKQRKEEEQRRQMREAAAPSQSVKDNRDKETRERNDKEIDAKESKTENRELRPENRDIERMERHKDDREARDKERLDNRDRDRIERDRFDNRDRSRIDSKDRQESDKDKVEIRDQRNDNREHSERDRFERERTERDRTERDRVDRDRDRDRDFRDRNRDYGHDRDQSNAGYSKNFQANIPPRFLKQQQNRQHDDQHKAWAFSAKPVPSSRRQDPPPYNAPRHAPHNGRRSYSRDYSDREDDFRREKDVVGPQWRTEMHDYDKHKELNRSNSKDSVDHKERKPEFDKKSIEGNDFNSRTSAAEKLTEVFERKSIGLLEPFVSSDTTVVSQMSEPVSREPVGRRPTPPSSTLSQRESVEKDFGKTSWAEVIQDEQENFTALKMSLDKVTLIQEVQNTKETVQTIEETKLTSLTPALHQSTALNTPPITTAEQVNNYYNNLPTNQNSIPNQVSQVTTFNSLISHSISSHQSQGCLDNQLSDITQQSTKLADAELIAPVAIQNILPDQSICQNNNKTISALKIEKDVSESESVASKSSTDPTRVMGTKVSETLSVESVQGISDSQKIDKNIERVSHEQLVNKMPGKEPIERKSSGSGSERKGRGYGGSGSGGGYPVVYNRGWGSRDSRGRRSHRNSRSKNRASESDGSTDGPPNSERKERRRAPRSPRGPKKSERVEDIIRLPMEQVPPVSEVLENREPFAPRGQPSRRGRGGFQGTSRPPAPAKRVTGYGPPNTKSPFSQANRAVKENEGIKDNSFEDKGKPNNKPRTGTTGRGRDRRPKGSGPLSGEDENWETTSEHSEGGSAIGRRRSAGGKQVAPSNKNQGNRNQNQNSGNRQNNGRNFQGGKKDSSVDSKTADVTEAMSDLKLTVIKKDDEVVDDGFQEVRNKKSPKDTRGGVVIKDENLASPKQTRSHSNQGASRNGSSSRNSNDKPITRGSAPIASKQVPPQYDRSRQANLAPRFVKQRQKQMAMATGYGTDPGVTPPPPLINAWDKPIAQTLRSNIEEPLEAPDNKSSQSSQRSTPAENPTELKVISTACALVVDNKSGVLDGTTTPVETIIFENTNYKTTPPAEALKPKYQQGANAVTKPTANEEISADISESRPLNYNGEVRPAPRSLQELISDNNRPVTDTENSLGLQMTFDTSQKAEDSSDMKLDFAFDSDLGQLTEEKSAKTLGLPRSTHMSTSSTISPLAADLNLKIASVKKVWEMPAVSESTEEIQFTGFEEANTEAGAQPNVCKVKPTQQLQSPPPPHYNHVGYQGGYGGLSVPSPPAMLFNSSQQLLGSSQQLPQQGGLYGAFLDQSRGQFGGFPGNPYGAGSAAPYNYQPPPDMFQSLPSQYRMAAAGGGAAFGQSGQLGNSPSTVLISSTSNSLMSATVKPSTQQIGAIGSKGGGVGAVGGVGGVNTYQQQYLGYSGPVGDAPYSLPGLLPRPAPPANSYYSPYQPPTAPAPTYPLQFTQPAQSGAFSSQFLSSQLQVAAAVQQMQQQYRAPLQQQFAPPQARPPPQPPLKSPLHEHANGFAPMCDAGSPTPKGGAKPQKPPHSPPQHKYHAPPPHNPHAVHAHAAHPQHPPPAHTPHQHHQLQQHQQHQHQQHQHQQQHQHHQQHQQHQQQMVGGNNGRCGGGGGGGGPMGRGTMSAPPRYPAPIQRPHAPALPVYRAQPVPAPSHPRPHHAPQRPPSMYYHHHQRNGAGTGPSGVERVADNEGPTGPEENADTPNVVDTPAQPEVNAE